MAIDFSQYAAVLVDLDGTLYHEDHPLPGGIELLRRFQRNKIRFACLTNSTTSPQRLTKRLAGMGLQVDPGFIYTAAAAACDYVMQKFVKPLAAHPSPRKARVFNLSTGGVHEMLDTQVDWVRKPGESADVVIAGTFTGEYYNEERSRLALQLLRNGAALVGICADRVYPSPRGIEFGSGALTAMLAYAANVRPFFTGKPEPIFFEELCDHLGVSPDRCILIGDNLESDIGGAKSVGMKTILTLTGVATRNDADKLPRPMQPDFIVNNLSEL